MAVPSLPPLKFGDAGPSGAAAGNGENWSQINVSTGGSKIMIGLVLLSAFGAFLWYKKHK